MAERGAPVVAERISSDLLRARLLRAGKTDADLLASGWVLKDGTWYSPEALATLQSECTPVESLHGQLMSMLSTDKAKVLGLFRKWDASHDGRVDRDEFGRAVASMGFQTSAEVTAQLFDSFDVDRNGKIEYGELYKQLRRGQHAPGGDSAQRAATRAAEHRKKRMSALPDPISLPPPRPGMPPGPQAQMGRRASFPGSSSSTPPPRRDAQREALEQMQQKAFTRWWNAELPPEHHIRDLLSDLTPGVAPMVLLIRFSGTNYKFTRGPKNRIKMMENLSIFLKTTKELGVKPLGVSPEDIADGHKPLLLSLTWRLVTHFVAQLEPKLQACESLPSRRSDELLRWIRANTEPWYSVQEYSRLGAIEVDGWTRRLADGRAFCALLHRYDEFCIDLDALPAAEEAGAATFTLQKALDVAMATFGAPRLLDASDVLSAEQQVAQGWTDGSNALPYDLRSMQLYVLKLREALRRHAEKRRQAAHEACEALRAEAADIRAWSEHQLKKLREDTATVSTLDRHNPPDVFKADRMQDQFERVFRRRQMPKAASRRSRLADETLPSARQMVVASAVADARIIDELPEGARAENVARSIGRSVDARRAAAESELSSSVDSMQRAWDEMTQADASYSDALWSVLVEKRTDLMIESAATEADTLSQTMKAWTSRLAAARAMSFKQELVDPWRVEGDSTRALSEALDLLHEWLNNEGRDSGVQLPGVKVLKARKAAFEAEYDDACRRRREEQRPPPPNLEGNLDSEWRAMQSAAQFLRAKVLPMMDWQEQQLQEHRKVFKDLNRPLDASFDTKDAHSLMGLKDSIHLTIMKANKGAHHANPEAAVVNKWSRMAAKPAPPQGIGVESGATKTADPATAAEDGTGGKPEEGGGCVIS